MADPSERCGEDGVAEADWSIRDPLVGREDGEGCIILELLFTVVETKDLSLLSFSGGIESSRVTLGETREGIGYLDVGSFKSLFCLAPHSLFLQAFVCIQSRITYMVQHTEVTHRMTIQDGRQSTLDDSSELLAKLRPKTQSIIGQ